MLTLVSYKVIRMMPRIPNCYRVLFDCKIEKTRLRLLVKMLQGAACDDG